MKRYFLLFTLFSMCLHSFAQDDLKNLLTEYKASIKLPYYYKCKQLYNVVPDEISYVKILDGFLYIDYIMKGDTKKNNGYYSSGQNNLRDIHHFTIQIDLKHSKLFKDNESYATQVWIECNEGIKIVNSIEGENFSEPFFSNWFTIELNSAALRDKVYSELNKIFSPYKILKSKKNVQSNANKTTRTSKSKKYGE